MTDPTAARRTLIDALLDGLDADALHPAERPLLRACFDAEVVYSQAMIDQFTADAPWLKATAEDQHAAQAAIARVRAQCVEWVTPSGDRTWEGRNRDDIAASCAHMILAALDGPAVSSAAPPAGAARRCPALHTGDAVDPSRTYQCERARGHDGPHRAAPDAEHHQEWPQETPEGVVPPGAAPTFTVPCRRCSVLVDVPGDITLTGDGTLPGHTCPPAADASEPQP